MLTAGKTGATAVALAVSNYRALLSPRRNNCSCAAELELATYVRETYPKFSPTQLVIMLGPIAQLLASSCFCTRHVTSTAHAHSCGLIRRHCTTHQYTNTEQSTADIYRPLFLDVSALHCAMPPIGNRVSNTQPRKDSPDTAAGMPIVDYPNRSLCC